MIKDSIFPIEESEARRFLAVIVAAGVDPSLVPIKPQTKRPAVLWRHLGPGEVVPAWDPSTNAYGLLTGERSRTSAGLRLVAIELDKRPDEGSDGFAWLAQLEQDLGQLPVGLTIASPGGDGQGRHRYFLTDVPIKSIAGRAGTPRHGFDVRGEGGQILIAGSRHPKNGKIYTVEIDAPPPVLPAAWAHALRRDGGREAALVRTRERKPHEATGARTAAEACFVACGGHLTAPGRGDCPFPEDHASGRGEGYVSIDERGIRCWSPAHSHEHAHAFNKRLRGANPSAYTAWTLDSDHRAFVSALAMVEAEGDAPLPALVPAPEAQARLVQILRSRDEADRLLVHVDTGAGKTYAMTRDLIERVSDAPGFGVIALPTNAAADDVIADHAEHATARGVDLFRPRSSGEVCVRADVLAEIKPLGLSPQSYGACFSCEHRATCEREQGITAAQNAIEKCRPAVAVITHAMVEWADEIDLGPRYLYVDENPREPIVTAEIDAAALDAFRAAAAPGGLLDRWGTETIKARHVRDDGALEAARAALDAFESGDRVDHDHEEHLRLRGEVAKARRGRRIDVRRFKSAGERARRLLAGTHGETAPPFRYVEIQGQPDLVALWTTWRRLEIARSIRAEIPSEGALRVAGWHPLIARAHVLASAAPHPAVVHVLGERGFKVERLRVADACDVERVWIPIGQSMSSTFKADRAAWVAAFRAHVLPEVARAARALVAVSTKAQATTAREILGAGVEVVNMAQVEGRNEWRGCDLVLAFGGMVPATPAFGRGSDVEAGIDDASWSWECGRNELAQVFGRARTRAQRRSGEPDRVRLVCIGKVPPADWAGLDVGSVGGADLDPIDTNRVEVRTALAHLIRLHGSKRKTAAVLDVNEKALRKWEAGSIPAERVAQILSLARSVG